jgi:pimeloyl-ACP methyl ester carboxylesterase
MKFLYRALRIAALVYLGVCLVLWFFENSLFYHPTKAQAGWVPPPVPGIEDVDMTAADGTHIHGWWLPCPGADQAVLYCHGNAGNLSHRGGSIAKMRELLKMNVLIFDYPGYGKSGGRPTERGCCQAADAAYAYLTDTAKIDPKRIVLFGGSLGGGVAVDLAARKPHRALVLAKTFTSAPDVGAGMYPWLPRPLDHAQSL